MSEIMDSSTKVVEYWRGVNPGDQTITAARRYITWRLMDYTVEDIAAAIDVYQADLARAEKERGKKPVPMGAQRFFSSEFESYVEAGRRLIEEESRP